jgi:hypothetical protein
LACSACGAPLHDLKRLPEHHPGKRELVQPSAVRQTYQPKRAYKPKKTKYKKRRKGLFRHIVEEAFDVIEDIFD